ncbi:SCP-like protein [Ancylostoma ceylanicum]|uniref:SCP-like protein n=1 Tax=Ancylostoma ceylanicum TaxID=53326 RepID=A0A0D6M366_9BILA|nr:SCP-like protein [Ancylostoma ceylanicum]
MWSILLILAAVVPKIFFIVEGTTVTIPSTCQDDKLTNDSHNAALWMHNYYRKLLASGWAKDPKSNGGYAVTAKQMRELKYDCTGTNNLAKKTYDLIESCPKSDPQSSGYSLNFKRFHKHDVPEQEALEEAIKEWWGQLGNTGLGSDTTFRDDAAIANFAKMAYDKAENMACAVKNCQKQGQTLVACQYSSPITNDEKIYETGDVCSGCKAISKTCSNPRGLCIETDPFTCVVGVAQNPFRLADS